MQGWQEALAERIPEPWVKTLELDKVRADVSSAALDVFLKSGECVEEKRLVLLRRAFAAMLPQARHVRVFIACPALSADFEAHPQHYSAPLTDALQRAIPSAALWLEGAAWGVEGKRLTIALRDPMAYELFAQADGERMLQTILGQWFEQTYTVRFHNDAAGADTYQEGIGEEEEKRLLGEAAQKQAKKGGEKKTEATALLGKMTRGAPMPIGELGEDSGTVTLSGRVMTTDERILNDKRVLFLFDMTDGTGSVSVKAFLRENEAPAVRKGVAADAWVQVHGRYESDKFAREHTLSADAIMRITPQERLDQAQEKRVELHLHTQMSALDGLTPLPALFSQAAKWGHDAVAITDHGVVQAFPEAYEQAKRNGVRVIFGMEAYLVDDVSHMVVSAPGDKPLDTPYVVVDVETTGFDAKSEEIIEIGAAKICGGTIVDTMSVLVDPLRPIPQKITELTGITDEMVRGGETLEKAMGQLVAFAGDAVVAAHNAPFDMAFLQRAASRFDETKAWRPTVVDTLALCRALYPEAASHALGAMVERLQIPLDNHHRASDDACATAELLLRCIGALRPKGATMLYELNRAAYLGQDVSRRPSYHAIFLVRNREGLENLYRMVSLSHLHYFYGRPRIPKSELMRYREGLLIGTACEAGEMFRAVLDGAPKQKLHAIADFYDYYEIQPDGNNAFLLREGKLKDADALHQINLAILQMGERKKKLVVAACDVHFLHPQDEYFRRILMSGQGFQDADSQAPIFYRTTEEMLAEFAYLGEKKAYEVVVTNTRAIAAMTEHVKPFPDELYAPKIEGAEEEIRSMAMENALKIYGDPLPDIVEKRLVRELNAIIGNQYAVLYLIAYKLVKKSLSDGYIVGSRGSVGSSLVATMTGITEVNPLGPHYVCASCRYSDFEVDRTKYSCGADLPERSCPRCDAPLQREGYDIPFEVFMGFKGNKVPDIDLNFSGEYQPTAHKYVEELFGEGHVFRAGTISTIADKTAYGFVRKYLESKNMSVPNAEINRLTRGCAGVKRTTGQHPGGIIVVPKENDIHQFSAVQHPADDREGGIITSHYDFNSLHDRLVKLDILGHDDPTMIHMLERLTGIDARAVPLSDPATMSLFSSTEALGIPADAVDSTVGTVGIPEFGTPFVRQMLLETRPTTMAELLRISGLSHGTDVWINNAQVLIQEKTATLSECICTRDDIMNYLIDKMDALDAFNIMESVRKGKGLVLKGKHGPTDMEPKMLEAGVPKWFVESCKKIKYMFPKAHAAAYVMMAFRIAYFKVHHPLAFYATYYSVRANDFEASMIEGGYDGVKTKLKEMGNAPLSEKEKKVQTILEVLFEMFARGIAVWPVDLYQSDATQFTIEDGGLRLPLNAISGLGNAAAESIVAARAARAFIYHEDLL